MTWGEFSSQFRRLESRWKNVYVEEVLKLFWREVKDFDARWLSKTIDNMIMSCRHAPLMPEFGPFISEERDRRWRTEKGQNEQDSKRFWDTTFGDEEIKSISGSIKKRMAGGMTDSDWSQFKSAIGNATRGRR